MEKKLYRSVTDKKVAGVCGGIAEYFGIDSTLIRLGFAALVIFAGTGLLAYLVCALIIPAAPEGYTPYTDVNNHPENGGFDGGNGYQG